MKILLPLDGSPESESALAWPKLFARPDEDEFTLIRSYLPFDYLQKLAGLSTGFTESASQDEIDKALHSYLEEQEQKLASFTVSSVNPAERPANAIIDQSEDCDLIVMARRGRGGLTKLIMGSVVTQVVRTSQKPVLVIPPDTPKPSSISRIMLCLDGSTRAEFAMEKALEFADRLDAEIVLYQGVFAPWKTSSPVKEEVIEAQKYLDSVKPKLEPHCKEVVVLESIEGPKIVEQAEELNIDLIVLCSHGRSGLERWVLGSVTENVLQRARCPVMVVYNRPD